jgi:transcriptional regulator with XRE-family HTH domain
MIEKVILPGHMTSIREVLAKNLKETRRKRGFTQEQLAEKANVSTHYIAMIETCKTFPKPEMLEHLSLVMEIEPHDLFYMPPSTESALEILQDTIIAHIEDTVGKAIRQAFAQECKTYKINTGRHS